jgi:hypothetical protein
MSNDLSAEEATAIWQAVNNLHPQLDGLPNLAQGQVISALLGIWVSQHHGIKHREELMQWAVKGALDMATMVDAGIIKPQIMGTAGNA